MAFVIQLIEFVLIPGTIVGAGLLTGYNYSVDNDNKSKKIALSQVPIIDKKDQEKIKKDKNAKLERIKNQFNEAFELTEKVTREPVTFSYKPGNNALNGEKAIKAQVNFVLEPDTKNGKEAETIDLSLNSSVYVIKRWIPKSYDENSGSQDKKELPECRYSGDMKKNLNKKETSGIASKYLENMKKLVDSVNNKCSAEKSKGITNQSPESK